MKVPICGCTGKPVGDPSNPLTACDCPFAQEAYSDDTVRYLGHDVWGPSTQIPIRDRVFPPTHIHCRTSRGVFLLTNVRLGRPIGRNRRKDPLLELGERLSRDWNELLTEVKRALRQS